MVLLLPIIDLLQQFEDYVRGIVLLKKKKIYNNKKISLKIQVCTKPGVSHSALQSEVPDAIESACF